ncbi:hypothetical protein LSUE1_G008166 [Lachnellula suecica]|uniref:Cyanovirin-N domain-containing protein n=1 Tax=Lachnellula suecica TaxID=602035 RepID=A0A8T9CD08_9HELO|nr:hypothetical protein LSUE1_G008166 [Lachnellula suecica]
MVQTSIIAIALTSALSSLVAANSCKTGGIYCGTSLLKKGNYITNINTGLAAQSLPETTFNQDNSLWACTHNGQISFTILCPAGCLPNGSNDDTCQVDGKREVVGQEWSA